MLGLGWSLQAQRRGVPGLLCVRWVYRCGWVLLWGLCGCFIISWAPRSFMVCSGWASMGGLVGSSAPVRGSWQRCLLLPARPPGQGMPAFPHACLPGPGLAV